MLVRPGWNGSAKYPWPWLHGPIQDSWVLDRLANSDRTPLAVPASSQPAKVRIGTPPALIAEVLLPTLATVQDCGPWDQSRYTPAWAMAGRLALWKCWARAAARSSFPRGPSTGSGRAPVSLSALQSCRVWVLVAQVVPWALSRICSSSP